MKTAMRRVAIKAGISCGALLALSELGFGAISMIFRPAINDFAEGAGQDFMMLMPLATASLAFMFLIFAIYFACGMIVAKWLAPLPIGSRDIAIFGAFAGAVAEAIRSIMAVAVNLVLSLIMPVAQDSNADVLGMALANAGMRLVCGLPAFVILAAIIAGISAYLFSIIFFRPENAPK